MSLFRPGIGRLRSGRCKTASHGKLFYPRITSFKDTHVLASTASESRFHVPSHQYTNFLISSPSTGHGTGLSTEKRVGADERSRQWEGRQRRCEWKHCNTGVSTRDGGRRKSIGFPKVWDLHATATMRFAKNMTEEARAYFAWIFWSITIGSGSPHFVREAVVVVRATRFCVGYMDV